MRFTIFPSRTSAFVEGKEGAERPLAARLAFLMLIPGLALCLFVGWLGFRAASSTLNESLPALPLLEAKIQAEKFENLLKHLSRGLFRIAQLPDHNPQIIRAKLPSYFHESLSFVAEFGLKAKEHNSFLLLRDSGEALVPVSPGLAPQGPYAPFAQVAGASMNPGAITLLPAVLAPYSPAPDQRLLNPVIRLALPLDGERGTLILGLDLKRLHAMLDVYIGEDSPLFTPIQDGNLQLSFFFESSGWMLFELGSQIAPDGFFPDSSRRGYEGDIGRPGFDAAFRPWAQHETYWRMITDIRAGRGGVLPVSTRHYAANYAAAPTNLCYTPVRFIPAPGEAARVVGGIAFLEASQLPTVAFYRAANAGVLILGVSLGALVLLVMRAGRKLGLPLRSMAAQLQSMLHSGQIVPLVAMPICEEQQALLEAGNELITRNIALQGELARMQSEMQHAYAVMPVDLDGVLSNPAPHESFGLVGSSLPMQEVRGEVRKAGRSGADVLIWGETGTGKELVAAAIHHIGVSTEGPFISINCGALDENLLQDSLFGHVKGAFSEAKSDRKGAFASAEGGTLFLDEIANASLKVQQALLRTLAVRRVRPLGSDMEIPFTARIVTATNVDLREQVRKGLFREDLYYRLATISITTPALRRRKEDIPELAAYFIHEAGKRLTRAKMRLSRGALEAMMEHSWPGNVRELKNCITRAVAFMEGDLILRQHILIDAPSSERSHAGDKNAAASGDREKPQDGDVKTGQFDYSWEYLWPHRPLPAKDDIPAPPDAAGDPVDSAAPASSSLFENASHAAVSGLNDRQLLALRYMRKNGGITRLEYEKLTGANISARTMQNDLRMLIDLGVIRRIGGGPKTRYTLRCSG